MRKSPYDRALREAKLPAGNFRRIGAAIEGAPSFGAVFALCGLSLHVLATQLGLSSERRFENG